MFFFIQEIDQYINRASDQGYSAILSLGSKGFNYATNVVLATAIKVCVLIYFMLYWKLSADS